MFSQLDVYWAANFGAVDVPAVLARHAARVPVLHIKDGPLVRGEPHTAVGAGKMDIPAVIHAADENVLEWLVVELDECATDMTQAVRESCKYLVGEGFARGK
jgi:sugar phosphate isomerase/epimerase